MKNTRKPQNKGQVLVLFAIGLVVLIAVAALLVDGGQIYMNRRGAQGAADAAALAGARELCLGAKTEAAAETTAITYATTQNQATTATADANLLLKEIDVTVTIHQSTFFASLLGFGALDIPASAGAACLPPGGDHILPIAWACPDIVNNSGNLSCDYETLDWDTQMKPLIDGTPVTIDGVSYPSGLDFDDEYIPGKIYIMMDSLKVTLDTLGLCRFNDDGTVNPDGYMNCEDLPSGGGRSWLDLNGGGGGASELVNWINNGYPDPLAPHTWIPEQSGNIASIYNNNNLGDQQALPSTSPLAVRFLPVYNAVCDGEPDIVNGDSCTSAAHSGVTGTDTINAGTGSPYFHLLSIAEFYITCVDRPGGSVECPYRDSLGLPHNDGSIEGYFVTGYPFPKTTAGEGKLDMGIYTVSLIR